MTRLKLAFVAFALVVIAAWLFSIDVSLLSGNFWSVRGLAVLLTGILAIAFMSAAILLAAKPVQMEGALVGLDKFYRLHKWLGIAAFKPCARTAYPTTGSTASFSTCGNLQTTKIST